MPPEGWPDESRMRRHYCRIRNSLAIDQGPRIALEAFGISKSALIDGLCRHRTGRRRGRGFGPQSALPERRFKRIEDSLELPPLGVPLTLRDIYRETGLDHS